MKNATNTSQKACNERSLIGEAGGRCGVAFVRGWGGGVETAGVPPGLKVHSSFVHISDTSSSSKAIQRQ